MNEFHLMIQDIDFEDKELNNLLEKLNNCYKADTQNFENICYCVYHIKMLFNQYMFNRIHSKSSKYDYTFDTIMQNFGLCKSTTSRLISCYEHYFVEDKLEDIYKPFSKCKLFELLGVSNEQLKIDISSKILQPHHTIQTIREYVKKYTNHIEKQDKQEKPKKQEINEEEIEECYKPNKKYTFQYFEKKTKSQLLNIIMQLQDYVHKEKKKCQ